MSDLTTETATHTPGPWMIGDVSKKESPLMVYCDDALGSRVADLSKSGYGIPVAQDFANARLIAAAPELLELAKQFASECARCLGIGRYEADGDPSRVATEDCDECADIRAVIARAEGRS